MLIPLLAVLILLWLLGYIQISGFLPDLTLFFINGHPITLWNVFILLVLLAIIGVLPNPFRAIGGIFLLLWILSVLGIFVFAGLSTILLIAIIVGLIVYTVSGT